MTHARAAEVLRNPSLWINEEAEAACEMGADALEFQAWLFADMGTFLGFRVQWLLRRWNGEDSFLDYCRGEWEKERRG